MATKSGYAIGKLLVEKYGWQWNVEDDESYGDQWVIDPELMEGVSPHEGLRRQIERCGGESSTDSPLRELDPLRWSALRACEFSETVPYCTFDGEPVGGTTCAEAFIHLSNLARYFRREDTK